MPSFPRPALTAALALLLAAPACGEVEAPRSDPPDSTVTISPGDSAVFQAGAGNGVWLMPNSAGRELNVFIQVTGGSAGQTRSLMFLNQVISTHEDIFRHLLGAAALGPGPIVNSAHGDSELEGQATGRFYLHRDTTYRVSSTGASVPFRVWFYEIDRRPELGDSLLVPNYVFGMETIDHVGDVDRFTFVAAAGEEFNLFLRGANNQEATNLSAVVPGLYPFEDAGAGVVTVDAKGTDSLLLTASGRFRVDSAGPRNTYVFGNSSWDIMDRGPYELFLYNIDRRPESADSLLVPGAVVTGEEVDLLGDVDRFRIVAAAGDEYNVFFRSLSGNEATRLRAFAPGLIGQGSYQPFVEADGLDTLLRTATGNFGVGADGGYSVYVQGNSSRARGDRGPYEILLHKINRDPEQSTATLALGDSALETVSPMGDIDQFSLPSVAESTEVNFVMEHRSPVLDGGLVMYLTDRPDDRYLPAWDLTGRAYGSGVARLLPGVSYQMRVFGASRGSKGYDGPYALRAYQINRAPEVADSIVALADTVDEALDPPGDIDTFYFDGLAGQHVTMFMEGPAPSDGVGGAESLARCPGQELGWISLIGRRQTLPVTGRYSITVSPVHGGHRVQETGPYRLALLEVQASPEAAGQALVVGDSVTTESMDVLGDVDEFLVTGSPDSALIVLVHSFAGPSTLKAAIIDDADRTVLAAARSAGFRGSSGMVAFPGSGALRLRVSEREDDCTSGEYFLQGPYRLWAVRISRGPESARRLIAVGDTVSGERVDPEGDVDEYEFQATTGDTLVAYLGLPVGTEAGELVLEVVNPANQAVLDSLRWGGATSLGPVRTGPFVIPADGAYRVRVRGGEPIWGRGAYQMLVARP